MVNLSVVTITQDSEETIADLVKNALEIGDESIVVDVGSADRTAEAARQAGARVFSPDIPRFDYSSPRNFGARKAEWDWVLQLDTDERIDARYRPVIRKAIESGRHSYYDLLQINPDSHCPICDGDDESSVHLQARLYDRVKHSYFGLVYEWLYPLNKTSVIPAVIINRKDVGSAKTNGEGKKRLRLADEEFDKLVLSSREVKNSDDAVRYVSRFRHLAHLYDLHGKPENPNPKVKYCFSLAEACYLYANISGLGSTALDFEMARFFDSLNDLRSALRLIDKPTAGLKVLSDEELDFLSYTRLSATGDFAYALESFRELESRGYSPTNFQLKSYLLRKAGRIRESEEAWAAFKREIPEASLLEKKVDLA